MKCKLSLKENIEYKVNLYSVLLFDFLTLFVYFIFFSIYSKLIDDIILLSKFDFVLYYCLLLLGGKFVRFFFLRNFKYTLISGNLNIYLTKPVNSFFLSSIIRISGANTFTAPILLGITIILILLADYTNYIISFVILFFGFIYYSVFFNFFQSFAFFLKDNDKLFFMIQEVNFFSEKYLPRMFENMRFGEIFYLFPSSIFGYFVLMALKGNLIFFDFISIILITFLIFVFGTYLFWYFGLKKYEAFG